MGLESHVVHLAEEIEGVKRELGDTRTALRELLDRLGSTGAGDAPRGPAPSAHAAPAETADRVRGSRQAGRQAAAPTGARQAPADGKPAGLSLSHGDLAAILAQAGAANGATGPGSRTSALSLHELARTVKSAARTRGGLDPRPDRGPAHSRCRCPSWPA